MGYAFCRNCGKEDYRDCLDNYCCPKDEEGELCVKCNSDIKLLKCDRCSEQFCEDHGNVERKDCCGLNLCGDEDDPDNKKSCINLHVQTRRACGHFTCNFSKIGCIVCKTEGDVDLAKELKKICKSPSLKLCLSEWLKESQRLCKEANKDLEKISSKTEPTSPANGGTKRKR